MTTALHYWLIVRAFAATTRDRLVDEAGEGVISTAIAVLIIAVLGATMWLAFEAIFNDMKETVTDKVGEIS